MDVTCVLDGAPCQREESAKNGGISSPTSEMWARFWALRDVASRNALLIAYEPMVRKTVAKLPARVRANADFGDLCSFARLGLIDAINKCDEHADLPRFAAYASYRMRGAVIDELRRWDWVPRSTRRRVIEYRTAVDELSIALGRTPQDAEVFASMNVGPDVGSDVLRDVASVHIAHLPVVESNRGAAGLGGSTKEIESDGRSDPAALLIASERRDWLRKAIAQLSQRQRTVVERRFMDGLTQRQIAQGLGVTTARICQIEAAAIRNLRAILGDTSGEFSFDEMVS